MAGWRRTFVSGFLLAARNGAASRPCVTTIHSSPTVLLYYRLRDNTNSTYFSPHCVLDLPDVITWAHRRKKNGVEAL